MKHVLFLFLVILSSTVLPSKSQTRLSGYDEVFPVNHIRQGTPAKSKSECDDTPYAVWVSAKWINKGVFSEEIENTTECIRYFPSDNVKVAKTAIFFFSGDIVLDQSVTDSLSNPGYARNSYKAQIANSNLRATSTGYPFVHVGRPGMFGSTGNTATHRHSLKEAAIINAALDAIKVTLGYSRVSVVGQSGGGGLVGALLTSGRTDLDCIVISSGSVSLKTSLKTTKSKAWVRNGQDTTGLPYRQLYDSIDFLGNVKTDLNRRIFMLSDPDDQAVSYVSQKEFSDRANKEGVQIFLMNTKGNGKLHHNTSEQGILTAGRCLEGMSDSEIATKITESASAISSSLKDTD